MRPRGSGRGYQRPKGCRCFIFIGEKLRGTKTEVEGGTEEDWADTPQHILIYLTAWTYIWAAGDVRSQPLRESCMAHLAPGLLGVQQ